jgi:hypothetical protein
MADKKLIVTAPNAISDDVKESVLKAANVPNGAAKIVRDANGKVVEVIIHLPESASEAAAAAIAATPGVSNVDLADIPGGYEGWDGTLVGKDNLVLSGYTFGLLDSLLTYNEDGTCTVSAPSDIGRVVIQGSGKCASYPLANTVEVKCSSSGTFNVTVSTYNDYYEARMSVGSTGIYALSQSESSFFPVTSDALMHTYKMVVSSSGLLTVYRDSDSLGSLQISPSVYPANLVACGLTVRNPNTLNIDYIRWTKRP